MIIGRQAELSALRAAPAVVLEGEAGLGKTTLLEAALLDTGCRVLRCRPAPAETQLAFAALADLLADVPLPDLPAPQRRALEIALQRREAGSTAPDVRAIAGGVIGTLRALAPVLVAIDDAQWLDAPSRTVLEFALRRFDGRVLVAQRPGAGGLGVTERITLGPLEPGALHLLLESRGFRLSRPALKRLHERSGGNPFYALQLASGDELPVEELPEAARELAQRVALLYDRTVESALAEPGALDAAIAAGVLEVNGRRVAFTHPLLAEAARRSLGPEREASLHSELAEIEPSAEARALHLAHSTCTPDRAVADQLAAAADDAARRGGADTAARLYEHAARLDPERAARHRLAAAEHHVTAGDPQRAHELLAKLSGPEALSLRSWLHTDLEIGVQLGEQAVAQAGENAKLIAVTRQRLSTVERIRGNLEASEAHGRAAVAGAQSVGDEALALASLGLTRFIRGAGVGPELRRAAELERQLPEFLGQQAPSLRLGFTLLATDAFDEARRVLTDAGERALAAGHEDARAIVLSYLVDLEYGCGRWEQARAFARDALELSRQASSEQERNAVAGTLAQLEAGLGNVDAARRMALDGLALADQMGDRVHAIAHRGVLGFLELSLGTPEAAAEWLAPATDELVARGGIHFEVIRNEVEARVALGDLDRAERLTAHLEARTNAARCRALLLAAHGELDAAREQLQTAADAHAERPLDLARTLIATGAVERRAKQWRASRTALERAIAILEGLPAPLWAARAHAELARLGARPGPSELSATEARIAALAAEGRSNPEIAAAVFVSRKTVEANLSKVYRKLGVRSRVELARTLR